jgi:rod shape-determining protein MreD
MSGGLSGRLNPVMWLGVPMILCAVASVVLATPFRLFGQQLPEPVFALVPAFAWAVIRPSILPPFALLVLGVFLDALWGSPLGLWPVCLLAAYAPVLIARPFLTGQEFVVMWVWYAIACALAFAVGYLLIAARAGAAPGFLGVVWQFLVSAALFPLAHRLIATYEDADVRFR